MALVIKNKSRQCKNYIIFIVGLVGLFAIIDSPLSQAGTVHSPAKPTVNNVGYSQLLISRHHPTLASNGHKKAESNDTTNANTKTTQSSINCTTSIGMRINLSSSSSFHLQKLAEYEQVCNSGIVDRISFFTSIPTTIQQANEYAADVAAQLREFSSYGVSPLVFLEPTTESGLIDMSSYRTGAYDAAINAYFAALKSYQITDEMMGIWIPFPEGNLPVWSSVDPNDFAACVAKTITYQKSYFPFSRAGILLDTLTYPASSSWQGESAVSLAPYVRNIPSGLVDNFGLQGFPWSAAADEGGYTNGTPRNYLRIDFAAEAANILGVKDIWLNTGSYGVIYANQQSRQITATPEQRLALLNEAMDGANTLKSQGFNISMHLFAENKSNTIEATDWSYWPSGGADASPATYVFKSFVHNLQSSNIPLWLFDSKE
jgi:hypothetical protein